MPICLSSWYEIAQKNPLPGKVLGDEKTVESCQIKEKDFLVLMVSKVSSIDVRILSEFYTHRARQPKPTPAASTSTASTSTPAPAAVAPPATESAPATAPAPAPAAPAAEPAPAAPAAPAAAPPAFGDMSSFLTGEALQSTIQNMVEMGFPRDQVLRALRASYNNPDRAVDYLMNVGPFGFLTQKPVSNYCRTGYPSSFGG